MKKSRGITLIALVITIAVMIVLVSTSIMFLVSEGVILKADEAATETQEAVEREKKLGGQVEVAGNSYNSMQGYVDTLKNTDYVIGAIDRAGRGGSEIYLKDNKRGSKLVYDEIYIVLNNQRYSITSRIRDDSDLNSYITYSDIQDEMMNTYGINFDETYGRGNYNFVIVKDGVEYTGTTYIQKSPK